MRLLATVSCSTEPWNSHSRGDQTTLGERLEEHQGLPVDWNRDHKRQTIMTASHASGSLEDLVKGMQCSGAPSWGTNEFENEGRCTVLSKQRCAIEQNEHRTVGPQNRTERNKMKPEDLEIAKR
jgi:hypothetical protein